VASPQKLAKRLLAILATDEPRLERIDNYLHGKHDDPYMPSRADDEYRLLAKRSVSNWMPLLVGTPAQALYVDGFRRGLDASSDDDALEWSYWQRSRMDARQAAVYRGALSYGHSFVVVEKIQGRINIRGLSPLRTAALFRDPANDEDPYAVLTVEYWPENGENGLAWMWDGRYKYPITLRAGDDPIVRKGLRHGTKGCPVTRFAASVDLEGRTVGVIEPMIPLQNRINQSVFDLLVAQTYGSFVVRTVSGMAPALQLDPETGEPVIDPATGHPIPLPIDYNARRFLFAEDPDAKFGSLDSTPLDGYIASIDMSIRHLASVSQTPPHHLLGQIANISAEALQAAETALSRKVEEFRQVFGEAWERVFRLCAELENDVENAENYSGEIIWRDMETRSLAQSADALGKLADQLGIPKRGLWRRVPNVRQVEINEWERLFDEDSESSQAYRASVPRRSTAVTVEPTPVAAT